MLLRTLNAIKVMKELFDRAQQKGMTYNEFCAFTESLVQEGKSTGEEDNPDMVMYTRLNWQRMKRLNKSIELEPGLEEQIREADQQNWVVITEPWCGDSAQALPFIAKMALAHPNIDLRIILRDDNPDMMDFFLTNGTRSIPILVGMEPINNDVLFSWGPRPDKAQKMVMDYKNADEPKLEPGLFSEELQKWYLEDEGRSIQGEILDKMIEN